MKRKTAFYLASAIVSAGLVVGCAQEQGDAPTAGGYGQAQGGAPILYGTDGSRTATVPPADAASGTGDHNPQANMDRMGSAAFNGAGSTDRPSVSDKAGIANQPSPNVSGNGGPVGSSPVNTDAAQPAGNQVAPNAGQTGQQTQPQQGAPAQNNGTSPRSSLDASFVNPIFADASGTGTTSDSTGSVSTGANSNTDAIVRDHKFIPSGTLQGGSGASSTENGTVRDHKFVPSGTLLNSNGSVSGNGGSLPNAASLMTNSGSVAGNSGSFSNGGSLSTGSLANNGCTGANGSLSTGVGSDLSTNHCQMDHCRTDHWPTELAALQTTAAWARTA